MRFSLASASVALAFPILFSVGCTQSSDAPPQGDLVQKVGSSATSAGCLSGLTSALTLAVHDLHFRRSCSRDPESGTYNWAYIHGDQYNEGDPVDTIEKCIDKLATHLNDHVPFLEIGLNERCAKKIKLFNGEKVIWAFDYRGR